MVANKLSIQRDIGIIEYFSLFNTKIIAIDPTTARRTLLVPHRRDINMGGLLRL